MVSGQEKDADLTPLQILLILQILVAGEEQVKFDLGQTEQPSITKATPSFLTGGRKNMIGQKTHQFCRHAFVDQYLHRPAFSNVNS